MVAVLGRFLVALNGYCKEKHEMDFQLKDYWVYEFAKVWWIRLDSSNWLLVSDLGERAYPCT